MKKRFVSTFVSIVGCLCSCNLANDDSSLSSSMREEYPAIKASFFLKETSYDVVYSSFAINFEKIMMSHSFGN